MKKLNLKELITMIKQNIQNEDVEVEIIDLPNNKIKHIIIGNKKVIQPKKQASMTTKQFQEYVIEFITKQEKFNEMILQKVDNIDQRLIKVENDIKEIKSCPTIQKELNSK